MRKSNALVIAGLMLVLLSLFVYDFQLKAAYDSGDYKIPYKDFVSIPFQDFDTIELFSSTATNAKLVQGPFSVRAEENAMEYMKIKQEGRRLIIRTEFENDYRFNPHQYLLVISCPKISFLSTNATYRSYNKEVTDTIVREDWKMRQVLIDGFAQDTLHIVQDYGSTVILDSNHIGHIYAQIGKSQHSGSNLIIQNTNHFQSASIYIENQSKLFLDSATIGNLDYHLADSARLIIDGRAINLLNNSKNLGK